MSIFKNKTFRNAFWLIIEKIFNLSISLITIAIIARYLGPEKYGMLNYSIALVALFAVFSTLGLDSVNIKSIVQKEAEEGTVLLTSFFMRIIGSLLIVILSILSIWIIGIEDKIQIILILIMSSVYVFKSFEVIEYWIHAYQISKLSSSVRMVVAFISTLIKISFVFFDLGIIYIGLVYVLEIILIAIGLVYSYFKFNEKKSKWNFSFDYVKKALSQSWYMIVSGIFVTIYTQFDKVMVGNIASKEELGNLAVAISISNLWIFIPIALINSFKPVIMKLKLENEDLYIKKIQQLYSLLLLINIFCIIVVLIFSRLIISTLFGDAYDLAGDLLLISVWAGCFSVFGVARGIWMLCEGIQKYSILYLGIGAVFSIVMNLVLIPKYGAIGATITILLTEILTTIITPLLFKKTRFFTVMLLKTIFLKDLRG